MRVTEVTVKIDDETLSLLKNRVKTESVSSIVSEAVADWAKAHLLRCPIDEKYCVSDSPCNTCPKAQQSK